MMGSLFDKRFVVVAGKGGVGRTTVSMILGVCAARMGKRTLVCLANAPLRYSELLGGVTLQGGIHEAAQNLHVVNLNPVLSREEYGHMVLPSRTLHRIVFGSRLVNAFFDAVPGLAEWSMLGKATYHALNETDGEPEYDMVVFDSPATGHGLDILALPGAIVSSVPAGRMREEAVQRVEIMRDHSRFEVIPVTVPEEMPVSEVLELLEALKDRGFPVERVVVNMISVSRASEDLEALVGDVESCEPIPDWLLPSAVEVGARREHDESMRRLEALVSVPLIRLPMISPSGLDEGSLLRLAQEFYAKLNDN